MKHKKVHRLPVMAITLSLVLLAITPKEAIAASVLNGFLPFD